MLRVRRTRRYELAKSSAELDLSFDDVVVLLASNERFAPYASVVVQSLLEHTSPDRSYDIVVLTNDISQTSARRLMEQAEGAPFGNVSLDLLDAEATLDGLRLPNRGRFRAAAHYRLLAPVLLPQVRKAVYLDADLVVLHDVAELFDVDLDGRFIAAVHDADTAGQYAGYDPMVKPYLENEVGLKDPRSYFQSGVLVMDLERMRGLGLAEEMVGLAVSRKWRWPDQDILNRVAQASAPDGRDAYVRLDPRWNVLHDWKRLRRSRIVAQAPAEVRAAYDAASADPYIVHYAGPDDRPWIYPKADRADLFWDAARRSPFHDELRRGLTASRRDPAALVLRLWIAFIYKIGMPAIDALLPCGTRRRAWVLGFYERMGGSCT